MLWDKQQSTVPPLIINIHMAKGLWYNNVSSIAISYMYLYID